MQKIVPHFWFDTQAKEAAEFYVAAFPEAKMVSTVVLPSTPSGDTELVTFQLAGQDFMSISAGPLFQLNPAISFMVNFDPSQDDDAAAHLDELWQKLSDGGTVLMPLDEYPFSKRYGWVQDRFGISWQLILSDAAGEPRPFIVPSLLFTGDNTNHAEEAMEFYIDVFKHSKAGELARYPEAAGSAKKGSLMFADFMLEQQWFAAMDSAETQPFAFNEGISLLINCDTQEEIDYYWQKLSAAPEAEQCGWLKDKYGVSWQVSPTIMAEIMQNGTPEQIARVTETFLQMKKFDIAKIAAAYKQ